jgi:integrase
MRATNKLSDTALRKTQFKPGLHGDGGGLYLRVSGSGSKSFVLIYIRNRKRTELGLGGYPDCTLATARAKAAAARDLLSKGGDPKAEKRKEAPPTLNQMTDRFKAEFESTVVPKLAQRWRSLVSIHAADLCPMRVDRISTADVAKSLRRVHQTNPASAKFLRSTLERIFNFAKGHGFIAANPAEWKGNLDAIIKPLKVETTHQASLPFKECPAFFAKLQQGDTNAKAAIRFLMLTATRTNDVIGMRWREIDGAIWTVPAERTKNRKEFKVPLTDAACAVIERQRATGGELKPDDIVFAGRFRGRPMSHHTMLRILNEEFDSAYTVHGFRSSFAQHAQQAGQPFEVIEACLQHALGNAVTRAYLRDDVMNRRRAVLEGWAEFLAA